MKPGLSELIETAVLAILIFLLVRAAVQNFRVEGHSMDPTLSTGEYLMVNKASYWRFNADTILGLLPGSNQEQSSPSLSLGQPQRGDIVVFRYPMDPSRDFIKRVIGLPGDEVGIENGKVYVNGKPMDEPYLSNPPTYKLSPVTVPPDNYFVLGDNRNSSSDSHIWGMVPRENIIGKAMFCYWPPSQWGLLPSLHSTAAQESQ